MSRHLTEGSSRKKSIPDFGENGMSKKNREGERENWKVTFGYCIFLIFLFLRAGGPGQIKSALQESKAIDNRQGMTWQQAIDESYHGLEMDAKASVMLGRP